MEVRTFIMSRWTETRRHPSYQAKNTIHNPRLVKPSKPVVAEYFTVQDNTHMHQFHTLPFDNTYVRLPDVFFERVTPTPFPHPHVVSINPAVAELLDLTPDAMQYPTFAEYCCGAKPLPADTLSRCWMQAIRSATMSHS